MRLAAMMAIAVAGMAGSGCVTEETQRVEGMTYGAGNALAANTAMQMVDPWQYGVQDTELDVPADRAGAVAKPAPSDSSEGSSSTDSSNSTTGSSD